MISNRLYLRAAAFALLGAVFAAPAYAQWVWTPQTGRFVNADRLPKETPELQVEYARTLLLEGRHKQAMRETVKFSEFYGDSEFADENQYLRGEIRLSMGDPLAAAREFQQVVANYPESELFEKVIEKQYDIADSFYELGVQRGDKRWRLFRRSPYKKAIQVYSMVIDNQPFTDAAAEAQYKLGLCHYARKEYMEAAFEYRRVIEDYGGSDWVDEASYSLATCYYDASLPAEYDQSPSRLAIGAIDEFKARFPADPRIAELEPKRSEMYERIAEQRLQTAKFYERRREFRAARISYEVVVEQFPGSSSAETAQQWLNEHSTVKSVVVPGVATAS